MNIDGLGESIITLLEMKRIIEDVADLYNIKERRCYKPRENG